MRISVVVAEKSLRATIPLIDMSLAVLEKNGGRTHLSEGLMSRLKLLRIERWAETYLDPSKMLVLSLLGIYTRDQLNQIGEKLSISTEEDQSKFWESLIDYASSENWIDTAVNDYMEGMSPEDMIRELLKVCEVGGPKFREDVAVHVQAGFASLTISFYNSLSMMAYGAPIDEWVCRAAKGDLQAYYNAYHVDQTVADIPCFAALHEKKKQELKGDFFSALSVRRRTPLIPPKLKYPKLWFSFSLLDSFGVLPSREGGGFSLDHLLDICVDLKIYGANYEKGVDDLSKRLRDYRKLQQRLMARKFTS